MLDRTIEVIVNVLYWVNKEMGGFFNCKKTNPLSSIKLLLLDFVFYVNTILSTPLT